MKILMLVDTFPPYVSGVSTYCVVLAKELKNMGHSVLIITPYQGGIVIPKGLNREDIIYLPSFKTPTYKTLRVAYPSLLKILNAVRKFKPDIISSCGPSLLGLEGIIASKINGVASITTFTTLIASKEYVSMIIKSNKTKLIEKILWKFFRVFFNLHDRVIAETDITKEELIINKVKKDKVVIAPFPIEFEEVKTLTEEEKASLRAKYGLKQNIAVYLGRLSPEKNIEQLMDIWVKVNSKNKNTSLLVVGGGILFEKLRKKVADLNLEEYIKFTGEIPHEEIINSGILNLAQVYVSASTSETLGIAGLEAMAHGTPVVLFKAQGLAEHITDSGFVVEQGQDDKFAECILKIFEDDELRKSMGLSAKQVASTFGTAAGTQRYITNYMEAIEKKKTKKLK